ncbi:MAG: hypothetical protein WCI60_02235 [bacterium]
MFATTLIGLTFTTIWYIIFLIIYIAFAFWPARVAARKGYSFLGFFILSLFIFFISLIIAYILPSKIKEAKKESDQ